MPVNYHNLPADFADPIQGVGAAKLEAPTFGRRI